MSAVTKDDVQLAARHAFKGNGHWGLLAMATGTGKSKIGVDETWELARMDKYAHIVLLVPTEKLRDSNWKDEFEKWGALEIYEENVTRYCYASAGKVKGKVVDLLILDEGHNLTALSAEIFRNNHIKKCLVLTATPPDKKNETDKWKLQLFEKLKIEIIFSYSLDQAVKDGLVAPYEIRVVECNLDKKTPYIPGGNKKKRFFQTEQKAYEYISKQVRVLQMTGEDERAKWKTLERLRMIYNLKSKTEIARRIILRHVPEDERYLIFCGSIEQAEYLCPNFYHSKTNDKALEAFKRQEINRLSVVEALNEGHNIEGMDGAVIVQLNSNKRDLVQRIGRLIRVRPNHRAVIWLLVTMDTVDENWYKKAIETLDKTKIVYHHYKNVI